MLGCKRQKPDDRLDYDLDFSRWLSDDDEITDATVDADGMIVESVQIFGRIVKVWISGGVLGKSYNVSVTVTTQNARVKEECFTIRVSEC